MLRSIPWLFLPCLAAAQLRAPSDGGRAYSLGQPGVWKWSTGGSIGQLRTADTRVMTTEGRLGVMRDIGNPLVGLAAFQLEGFTRSRGDDLDGGVRAQLALPFARVAVGGEYNIAGSETQWHFSLTHPVRRGGLFADGSHLRLDLTRGATRSFSVGVEKPIWRRITPGRTRPHRSFVKLSAPRLPAPRLFRDTGIVRALIDARQAADWIGRMTVPWLDHPVPNRRRADEAVVAQIDALRHALVPRPAAVTPRTLETEARYFHESVERAFSRAVGRVSPRNEGVPRNVAAKARAIVLDEVLLPYNRLLGQDKRTDSTLEFAQRARGIFLRWLHVESGVPQASLDDVLSVFLTLLGIVEDNRAAIRSAWGDSRFAWLPLQYALLPEEHDSQEELDHIIERAVGRTFSHGNFVSYVINEQFQFQLSRTIREARDYHVLWIHDVRGVDDGGDPDEQSFRHVLRSYLRAMTERAREYDRTGSFPTYIIVLDEWFYRVRKTRPWMNILESPMRHHADFPSRFGAWGDSLRVAQDSLRAAVAASRLLQAQRVEFGDAWLRDLVKVHVNITNAPDPSFANPHLARLISVPDNMLRDHRKVVFYDITEADPYRGEAIFTGAGVGEHYSNLSWEDRALLVRGPAVLHLKTAARQLMQRQGIPAHRLPWHLQPRARAPDYDARVAAARADARRSLRALTVNNETGYADKEVNLAKAILYTLMPSGSVITIPDSLWNSAFWGSALVGCALRGVRVLVIAPALRNAPAPAFGSMEHAHRLMWRLIMVSSELAPQLAERGGVLRVGLYASNLQVIDIPGKVQAVQSVFAQEPWLRDLFGFPPSVFRGLSELTQSLQNVRTQSMQREFESDAASKLHLKINSFASREAWQLMQRPEWVDMTWEFVQQRIAQVQTRSASVTSFDEFPETIVDVGGGAVQRWFDGLSPDARQRVVFYSVIGSQNQNARSMVMDGEVAFVMSGWPSIIPYLDLISLIGQCRWPDTVAELTELLPPNGRLLSQVAYWGRLIF